MQARQGITVLHTDDDPAFTDLVTIFLERESSRLETITAASTSEALDILEVASVDCIISDYDMPGRNGIEFLSAVRDRYDDLPFILFTGKGSEEVASDAISAGITDYLQKNSGTDQYKVLVNKVLNAVDAHRAERQMEQSFDAIEAASEGISILDGDGRYNYVNQAYADLFGYTPEEMLGEHWTLVYTEEGAEFANREIFPTLHEEGQWTGKTEQVRKDGTILTAHHSLATTGDGFVCTMRDVSERELLKQRRDRYRAAFEGAMDAMVIANDDGVYIDANQSACDLFGVAFDELLGKSIADFAPENFDFDAAWTQFERSEREHGTFPLVRPDGSQRTVEYAASASITPGEHLSVIRDVTDRYELEATLQSEQTALRDLHRIAADQELAFETKLRKMLDIAGDFLDLPYGFLTRIEDDGTQEILEVRGSHDDLHSGLIRPFAGEYCEATVESGDIVTVQNATEEGWTGTKVSDQYGFDCYIGAPVVVGSELYGTFCFANTAPRERTFTEMEQTLVELVARWVSYELEHDHTTSELQRQNERLDEFASMVSHDLRSPLSVAQGYLQLAREDGDPDHFDRAARSLGRMEQLIGNLLYLAREGEDIGATETVDLYTAIEDSWAVVNDDESEAVLSIADDIGYVRADSDRLHQLLENLLSNAVEHASLGVTVRVEPTESGFAVEDDGPGIPAADREKVFDHGYSTRADGSGFGLAIVRQIAEAHGWTVTVTESGDGGARFEFAEISVPVEKDVKIG